MHSRKEGASSYLPPAEVFYSRQLCLRPYHRPCVAARLQLGRTRCCTPQDYITALWVCPQSWCAGTDTHNTLSAMATANPLSKPCWNPSQQFRGSTGKSNNNCRVFPSVGSARYSLNLGFTLKTCVCVCLSGAFKLPFSWHVCLTTEMFDCSGTPGQSAYRVCWSRRLRNRFLSQIPA